MAVLPSARARERLRDRIGGVEKMIKEKIAAEKEKIMGAMVL